MRIRPFVIREVANQNAPWFAEVANTLRVWLNLAAAFGGIPLGWVITLITLLIPFHIFVVALLVLLVLLTPWTLTLFWEQILVFTTSPLFRGIAVLVLLLTSCSLYLARTFMRPVFGFAEVAVGIVTCWGGLSNTSANALLGSLTVLGGVYITVRGLDNIIDDDSLTEPYTETDTPAEGEAGAND